MYEWAGERVQKGIIRPGLVCPVRGFSQYATDTRDTARNFMQLFLKTAIYVYIKMCLVATVRSLRKRNVSKYETGLSTN